MPSLVLLRTGAMSIPPCICARAFACAAARRRRAKQIPSAAPRIPTTAMAPTMPPTIAPVLDDDDDAALSLVLFELLEPLPLPLTLLRRTEEGSCA